MSYLPPSVSVKKYIFYVQMGITTPTIKILTCERVVENITKIARAKFSIEITQIP